MREVRALVDIVFSRFPFFLFVSFSVSLWCASSVEGGNCWAGMGQSGRCTELLSEKVGREECCKEANGLGAAWSKEDLEPGTMFFWRVLGGGVQCQPCKKTCENIDCGEGKKCAIKKGYPKCICAPDCKQRGRHMRNPVCGSDGRNYKTVCRLRKRACRKNEVISVDYFGTCQTGSCDRVTCPSGKFCILDQNLIPHCNRCIRHCVTPSSDTHQVCGTDGVTYESACHLREAACRRGKSIPIAYRGHCKLAVTCANIQCQPGQTCLTDLRNGSPRCQTCSYPPSCPHRHQGPLPPMLCGSNHVTYPSWCEMKADECQQRIVIETKYSGPCHSQDRWKNSVNSNSVEDLINSLNPN
ncbi:hypothetical protein M8J75_003717 [Diaphorina citri]|nr:hypothetical protein M8J75_003717 [Diaphorina citri]